MRIDKIRNGVKRPLSNDRLVKYGLTIDAFDTLLKSQEGLCAICRSLTVRPEHLVVDHDHSDGAVRGLLCTSCNTGLGLFKDSRGRLLRALRYLKAARMRRDPG